MANTYFFGGSSASGFQTRFNEIVNRPGYFTYILKGGPGTGKSTLMKKIAEHFKSHEVELYYCSSDIRSLDAVVIHDLGIVVLDGTAPHVFNADYPGISQCLVDLGDFWDRDKLKGQESEIRRCFAENAAYHSRARAFITALSAVNGGVLVQSFSEAVKEKIEQSAKEILKEMPEKNDGKGKCEFKQVAAMTSEGYLTQPIPTEYRVIGIRDHRYAAGFMLMDQMKKDLLMRGYDIAVSECIMFPRNQVEHIRIPELNIQFSVINDLNKLKYQETVNCESLYRNPGNDEELFRARELVCSLEEEAAYSIRRALAIHDDLESYYIGSLDFKGLDRKTKQIIAEITSLI